jgi:hypothetical protein
VVSAPYRLQHLGMYRCIVIARKTSAWFHNQTI